MNGNLSLPAPPPPVWPWYIAYCVAMAVMYLACMAFGIVLLVLDPSMYEGEMDPMEARIQGVVMLVVGAVLFIPYLIAPFLPKKPWAWIYGIVMICFSMTSCCCLPASIPLLLFWIKPETKLFFGKM